MELLWQKLLEALPVVGVNGVMLLLLAWMIHHLISNVIPEQSKRHQGALERLIVYHREEMQATIGANREDIKRRHEENLAAMTRLADGINHTSKALGVLSARISRLEMQAKGKPRSGNGDPV